MKKIGIAGIGGIGSNVAVQLLRCGITELTFGDFDVVEESNFNRQFYFREQTGKDKVEALAENLLKICPTGIFNYERIKFSKDNIQWYFKDCHIIIEGFDNNLYKKMLVEELLPLGKVIISASGIAGPFCKEIKVRKITDNFYVVGDFVNDIKDHKIFGYKVMVTSSLMTEIALRESGYFER